MVVCENTPRSFSMDANTLHKVREAFTSIPEHDSRAKIGPRAFITSLVVAVGSGNKHRTSLADRRRLLGVITGLGLARSSFWQRMSSKITTRYLFLALQNICQMLANKMKLDREILGKLGVDGVCLVDSTCAPLPDKASGCFPAPRNNICPAGAKLHLALSLFGGQTFWAMITAATTHDRMAFPSLEKLKGHLVIFDLGYWNYRFIEELIAGGVFFLSRVKANAKITVEATPPCPKWSAPLGKPLRPRTWRKYRGDIIEMLGSIGGKSNMRIIGFWNPSSKAYHFYLTNLSVNAEVIWPLYRLRWQIELFFKAAKSYFALADIASANETIIINTMIAALAGAMLSSPIAHSVLARETPQRKRAVTILRAAAVISKVSQDLAKLIIFGGKTRIRNLTQLLESYANELVDPNYKHRPTSLERINSMFAS